MVSEVMPVIPVSTVIPGRKMKIRSSVNPQVSYRFKSSGIPETLSQKNKKI